MVAAPHLDPAPVLVFPLVHVINVPVKLCYLQKEQAGGRACWLWHHLAHVSTVIWHGRTCTFTLFAKSLGSSPWVQHTTTSNWSFQHASAELRPPCAPCNTCSQAYHEVEQRHQDVHAACQPNFDEVPRQQ